MKYTINKKSKESAYMQLYHLLREDITNSVYSYGDKMPSKRVLSLDTGSSVITVEHAYNILCDEGYITSKERSGYFVSYRKEDFFPVEEEKNDLEFEKIDETIKNDEDFPISVFSKTMRNVISKYGKRLFIKSPNQGSNELRGAICSYLKRSKGIDVSPSQIVIGSGAEYIYYLIVQLLGKNLIYGIENPSYEKIRAVYEANGCTCEPLKMGRNGILSSELNKSVARALHITPFNSFPSGISATASKRIEYISWAKKRNGIIIEDDFDSEFTVSTKNEDTVFSLEPERSVIYMNTFSKTIAPSMRIGYMVLPLPLLEDFKKKAGFYSCTVPLFEQYVIAEFINNGDFERHINKVRRKRRQELKIGKYKK